MSKNYTSAAELIGKTPLLRLTRIEREYDLSVRLFAKLEGFNPSGSVKDRIALGMIEEAERAGLLHEDSVIVEPTSGNTGVGLAAVAAMKGYRAVLVMPETMSIERRRMMAAFGAEIVLTEGKKGMKGAIERAQEIAMGTPYAFMPSQFTNPANPQAHYETTGPEIYHDTAGEVDILVAGVGTGGTITGVGRYLKERKPQVRLIAVEPAASPVLTEGRAGGHKIQGIGAGFVPEVLNRDLLDEVLTVTDDEAFNAARLIARREGVLVGISSGAALAAALRVAMRAENHNRTLVVIFPDSGDRYFSTPLFSGP